MNLRNIILGSAHTRSFLKKAHQVQTSINTQVDGFLDKTPTITLGVRGVIHGVRKTLGLSK